ncbi:MAG TPA: cell division protein FtsZ [Candidatus Dependentiae bacterium]|nr:cell division protein FtsZ [Candidatus Dependentiae bacterium]HRQ62938.1 cell division protein FtsZ [Candidatus Dependentiae bacterium]
MIEFDPREEQKVIASIKVLGIGGAGSNTVNSIIDSGYQGIDFVVANTDAQALELSKAKTKIQMGIKSTKGLGTGTNPEIGKRAAEEDIDKIMEAVGDADIVFLAAGMGGGTGSGAVPVIARALREQGILSIAIVTKPFLFEGKRRSQIAEKAIETLKKEVDTLIIIPNQKLIEVVDKHVSMIDAFGMINDVLSQSVRGISDIIAKPGHINVDFADVRTIMKDRGLAVMGTGRATGEERAGEAALKAISSPLLENMSIEGAHGVLLNITGGTNLGLHEISEAASIVYEQAAEDANIIIGSVIDPTLNDEVVVTIIATGFTTKEQVKHNIHASIVDAAEAIKHESEVVLQAEQKVQAHKALEKALDAAEQLCKKEQEAQKLKPAQADISDEEVSFDEQQEEEMLYASSDLIDTQDLDVPTYLRDRAEQKEQK